METETVSGDLLSMVKNKHSVHIMQLIIIAVVTM